MSRLWIALAAAALLHHSPATADEIGFDEEFALAPDRTVALQQLIPGTEEYYFYHCLHYQHTGEYAKVRELLAQWIKRHRYTARVHEIQDRQALLDYPKEPKQSLEHIRHRLGIHFNHQKQQLRRKTNHATVLNQALISRETLQKRAYSLHRNGLQGFEAAALDFLVTQELSADRRRDLLRRLQRPDYPGIAELVVADLKYKHSGGFGSHPIHAKLLLDQLDECQRLLPALRNSSAFIQAYITKLHPGADVNWRHDVKEKRAYLERLWDFVRDLDPAQNSLKVHVLYQRLVFDRSQGVYDKDRFMAYIKLPRNVHYINADYVKEHRRRGHQAELHANFTGYTRLAVVGVDEPLVRDYLQHFLVDAKDPQEFAPYIHDVYLRELFAETKIVNGVGDMEQWYSLLPPAKYKALKDRVDIELLPTNDEVIAPNDPVALDVAIKNVPTLIVKVYELNTLSYYKTRNEEISTAIDLDGLVANDERTVAYQQPPLRRHVEKLEFPTVKGRGVYVVELIGGGRSSRALVRKGGLRYTSRIGSAGVAVTVYNEANQKLDDASLWLAGHEYTADDRGEIIVPFSNTPGTETVVLMHNGFAARHSFSHPAEAYSLAAGIHADREALLNGRICTVVVRPELAVNGTPVDIGLLEEVALVIHSTDREGIGSAKEITDFELHNDEESLYEFKVPDNLARIAFTLRGKVQNLSQGKKIDLSASRAWTINQIDVGEKIEDLHLRHIDNRYFIVMRGKTGEAKPDRSVHVDLKHRHFTERVQVAMQTGEDGRIDLGPLTDIVTVSARGPAGTTHTWHTSRDRRRYPTTVHGRVGTPLQVPVLEPDDVATADALSLIELRGGSFARDVRDSAAIKDGYIIIDDLPAGDYDLWLKDSDTHIQVRLTGGRPEGRYLLGRDRYLERRDAQPLHITGITIQEESGQVTVQLAHAGKATRVHVFATRFMPFGHPFHQLATPGLRAPGWIGLAPPLSQYLSGRNIGDEYRYILERKYAAKYAGNMLTRPSLLLNPWSLRKTDTGHDQAKGGESWRAQPTGSSMAAFAAEQEMQRLGDRAMIADFANLDFLPATSAILANLRPDADGRVVIDAETLGPRQQLHVVAVDPFTTVYREYSLPTAAEEYKDLRLAKPLPADRHFTEQKNITALAAKDEFVIDDISTASMEVYDSLAQVYALFATLNGNPALTEFGFILAWPDLDDDRRRELYSKYACHELNFFLYHKDAKFFGDVIRPYLRNKKDKTFMDHWLLGDDLAAYARPWAHGRLNIVERILLGQRARSPAAARHVKDLYDLIPPDIERFNHLFKTAVKGSALETGDKLGFAAAAGELAATDTKRLNRMSAGKMTAGVPASPVVATGLRSAAGERDRLALKKSVAKDERKAKARQRAEREEKDAEEAFDGPADDFDGDGLKDTDDFFVGYAEFLGSELGRDMKARGDVRQLYRKLDKTEEWVENNYYHLPIEQQVAALVTANGFWTDYAAHKGKRPFLSTRVAEASRNFTEMMLALAVIDLPFQAAKHEVDYDEAKMTLAAGGSAIAYHKEIKAAKRLDDAAPLLTSQNFFAHDDRYRHENNERFDKFVTGEFRTHRVYGCQVVLTNPTSTRRKVDVLLQIPKGAMPAINGFYTRGKHVQLEPYSTQTVEYYFYFPEAGTYPHYPVHVAQDEQLLAFTKPFTFTVVDELTTVDKTSWAYISQEGTDKQVLEYLRDNNVDRIDLNLIAFRMRDKGFFTKASRLLQARHVYNDVLWSYGIHHDDPEVAREYLRHSRYANQCGLYIASELLTLDPVARHAYQHKEYWPLVNARRYQLGDRRKILNRQFYGQYHEFLAFLRYRPELTDADKTAAAMYLLLQDRVGDAMDMVDRVDAGNLATELQYDYLQCYLAFCREEPDAARRIAAKHEEHPVDRWRHRFRDVLAQADEIEGRRAAVQDEEDRTQVQTRLADTAASFDFKVEDRKIGLTYQNLADCQVNYYLMDIELLFSRQPFVQEVSGQFAVIRPNDSEMLKLPEDKTSTTVDLPKAYRDQNVMVEIVAGGVTKAQGYYPHSLGVQLLENYGQLRITDADNGAPLAKVYVKTYARTRNGRVQFYKDGYTDLRGRFDYASLNTDELRAVEKFSLLVMSEENGAVVREAKPPKM